MKTILSFLWVVVGGLLWSIISYYLPLYWCIIVDIYTKYVSKKINVILFILIWQSSFFLIRTNMHRTELCHEGWCSEICCKTWYNNCSPRYKSTYVLFSLFDVLYVYLLTRWYYHTGYKYYFRIFTQK